jgi:hypothetical protein
MNSKLSELLKDYTERFEQLKAVQEEYIKSRNYFDAGKCQIKIVLIEGFINDILTLK